MRALYTQDAGRIPEIPWAVYPRPQLRRERWACLNGWWTLSFGGTDQAVLVPYCAESLLSGLSQKPAVGETMIYRRSFSVPEEWRGMQVILHFGAVMRSAAVSVNGREVARHDHGYLSFSANITDALREGENELCVTVANDLDPQYAWGKQSRKRGGMWYTPCSGIWQTVWMEPVPERHVEGLRITNGTDWVRIEADGVQEGRIRLKEQEVPLENGAAVIRIREPRLWSPDDPYLYDFTLISGEDTVRSYFALRTLTTRVVDGILRLCLNGKPFFFQGLLDQGYWSDGLYTPAMPDGFEKDILAMKSLGFNTLRKHIKIEPEQFYYDCDRLGMIVFQDMVNHGKYRYVRDTVLPNLHFQKRSDRRLHRDIRMRQNFLASMETTVRQLRNHPCICLWTVFNEGWGQFCADDAYDRLRMLDDSRLIDSTSGWFHQKKTDVDSLHIYFDRLHLGAENRPQILSEFGGYVWKDPEHSFNPDKTYGYHQFDTREAFVAGLRALYQSLIPLKKAGLCAAVYTQVSDVEDETNGLLTFDRAVQKVFPEELRDLTDQISGDFI